MAISTPPMVGRKKLVKVGDEGTAGTKASQLNLIAANCYNIKCEPGEFFNEGERMPEGNYLGEVAAVAGLLAGKVSLDFDLAPFGPFGGTLTGGGQLATVAGYLFAGGSAGTLTPSSDISTRICKSFDVYEDGSVKTVTGCQGNITLTLEVGKKLTGHLEADGIWGGVADASMPAQAPITGAPYVCKGIVLTLGASSIPLTTKITIDLGAAAEQRLGLTASSGIGHQLVTEIQPKLTLDPEAALVATSDIYGAFLAGATAALSILLVSGGHSLTITAPAVQRRKVGEELRGKLAVNALELRCCNSSGDDALKFVEI